MGTKLKNHDLERVFSAIQRSYDIKKHIDLFIWLQNSVAEFIAHDVLLTAWGDFNDPDDEVEIKYDVASNVEGFTTRSVLGVSREANQCITYLYELWLDNNRHWYALNNFATSEFDCKFRMLFPDLPPELNSLLVFGVSDLRSGTDCLYVFFSKDHKFQMQTSALTLLMPHIHYALSKIQHLENFEPLVKNRTLLNLSSLTDRELEVIEWIKAGKTNQEIGVILNITQNTVKSHLKRVYQKLNVGKRAQAVALLVNY